jgi:hypothetical protein
MAKQGEKDTMKPEAGKEVSETGDHKALESIYARFLQMLRRLPG